MVGAGGGRGWIGSAVRPQRPCRPLHNLVYNLVRISRKYWRNLRSVLAKLTVGELPQWNDGRRTKGCAQRLRFCSNAYGFPFCCISLCLSSSPLSPPPPRLPRSSVVSSLLSSHISSLFRLSVQELQVVSPKPVLHSRRASTAIRVRATVVDSETRTRKTQIASKWRQSFIPMYLL